VYTDKLVCPQVPKAAEVDPNPAPLYLLLFIAGVVDYALPFYLSVLPVYPPAEYPPKHRASEVLPHPQ